MLSSHQPLLGDEVRRRQLLRGQGGRERRRVRLQPRLREGKKEGRFTVDSQSIRVKLSQFESIPLTTYSLGGRWEMPRRGRVRGDDSRLLSPRELRQPSRNLHLQVPRGLRRRREGLH